MKPKIIITAIALIELVIGLTTIGALLCGLFLSFPQKPASVFVFVFMAAITSCALGVGLLKYNDWARTLLIFFSGYIILTKALILANIIVLTGEIITFLPTDTKNLISVFYHVTVMLLLSRKGVEESMKTNN